MNNPKVNVVVSGRRNEYHSTYKTYILKGGIPFADQVIMPDTKYVIKYDFDLGGGTFDLDFSNADTHTVAEVTYYYILFIADGSKYTLTDNTLVFVDAEWNSLSAREIKPEKGTLFMIASITGGLHKNGYDINVVTVPENCILEFDGGLLDNGVIVGQDTVFINISDVDIWGENLTRKGTWRRSPITVDDQLSETSENPVQNKVVTEVLNDILASIANISLSVSPTVVFVGEQSGITIGATSNMAALEIKIKKGDTVIGTGSGTTLNASDVITPSNAGNIAYTAEFTITGRVKTASKNVTAVYPIYYGAGAAYTAATAKASARTTPAGTYNVTVASNGQYVWFVVPATMTINKATKGGFDFPLEAPQSVIVEGVAYKAYRSSNTYDAGTEIITLS